MNTLPINAAPRTSPSPSHTPEDASPLWSFVQRSDDPEEANDLAELWAEAERAVAAQIGAAGECRAYYN